MELSLSSLRYFAVLAEELHFGHAAESLHITAPSLSERITRLEASLGVRLFVRNSRRVELTDEGRELQGLVGPVLHAHDDIVDWSARLRERADPVLRVGIVATVPVTTPILAAARERIPGVRLAARRLGFTEGVDALLQGRVDVAFLPDPLPSRPTRLRKVRIWSEPRVLVVASAHPLAGRRSVRICETNDETFIVAPGPVDVVNWWVVDPRPDGSSPRRGTLARSVEEMVEMCAAGLGVNIAAASLATYHSRPDLRFIPVEDIAPAQTVLVRLPAPAHPGVLAFERVAREVAARPGARSPDV
ncbi:LysR family transcriptional regulator [Frankia sp. AgKG'84/4]|uniref:LysR family transcriptional regulator n=1 Tax=Frankia sp. AgKG'84/4 TaxID=573490 RepID=UPI00200FE6CF|nr:LysR family transcriptional regulator [Frankia sp. AgKG'84/4]MCL9794426.1 LysR family transcriptional regulator [Frankia sp. AgKG'84/4]